MVVSEKPSFLYVEDDYNSRLVIKILLQSVMNFTDITLFEDSHDFSERIAKLETVPDVTFLDIQIAPIDGYEMLKIIRETDIWSDKLVIAMTANVMSHDIDLLKKAGFDGLIGKPIIKAQFPQLVGRILAGEDVWFVP